MPQTQLGRHVYGLAAIGFGVITLTWRDFSIWQHIQTLGNVPHSEIAYLVAVIEIFGGVAIQWPKTARIGAVALGVLFLFFALLWVPLILVEPRAYDHWGNFFEQFSIVSGALIVYATSERSGSEQPIRAARIGRVFFGICVISFMLEHLFVFGLRAIASFVPKWIPPGQMFWSVTTTFGFGLAAIALLSGRTALLAARLLTVMLVGIGLAVWLPAPFANPHQLMNWAANAQHWAINGAAWIVADFLSQKRSTSTA
jgi:uncharacterized membrane protein YphA (DoxX/SURF4 family)